jgi:glucose-6-phosphate isomerase
MDRINVDVSGMGPLVSGAEIKALKEECQRAYKILIDRSGKGNDFLGWIDLPSSTDAAFIDRIRSTAQRLSGISEVFVVVGIGGSYLGARALIEALEHTFKLGTADRKAPFMVYAGHNISGDYLSDLTDLLNIKDYSLAVISKSGTTTEPAITFRLLKAHLENKYGRQDAGKRIIAITDREHGALKKLADKEKYEQYVIPDDVGGRYSVLTPVGLIPVAVAGFDIEQLIAGARAMEERLKSDDTDSNPAVLYACTRQACYKKHYKVEILANYEPSLYYLTEWWKQLFGESEGKEHKGIFPAGVSFSTDLHSMGQYIQDGARMLLETVITVQRPRKKVTVPVDPENTDGMNFLAGKSFAEINRMAELGTMLAHSDGGVPNMRIEIPEINEYYLGQLLYFFEFSCALSGYMLGVNPFDQPGVEAYKKNMFALLGKPGFEKQTVDLMKRLGLK